MSAWRPPSALPDLRRVGIVALDTETDDAGLRADRGSAWPWHGGHVCGVGIAYRADGGIRSQYFPIRHPETNNFDPAQVFQWLKDLVASDIRFITQNGLYDWGWLSADGGVPMPPSERLEEIGALATLIDENRYSYGLNSLCAWRGLPGKDVALLEQAVRAAGLAPKRKKKINVQEYIHQMPGHVVGPYGEADPANTLALWENLNPILDREKTRAAYRLEVDLLPMVLQMRRRGIRIDQTAAERARDEILQKRDAALAELSEKLVINVGMDEVASPKWKARTFDAHNITYARTEKGNPSFRAGKTGWMLTHPHWLPQLISRAAKYDDAANRFLQSDILEHIVGGRVHSEIHPHRSDDGGARSFRFSYSDPPLQQMPSRDKELAPLIRGVFLPEEGEVWAKPDISQQEFRFIVHYAVLHKLPRAKEAAELYRSNPDADFHAMVAAMTDIDRWSAKHANFAKVFGAGMKKFAEMIGKPLHEAQAIYTQYDRKLPFVCRLSAICQRDARQLGYTVLYDGARRHWDYREAIGVFAKGAGPCPLEEAQRRQNDPSHPWYQRPLRRAKTHTAMNALIQGSAARHTKRWMRACWREGIIPLLQMHDALDCSVTTREQGELVARLGCEAVQLEVPMRVDLKFGRSWGDATHKWEELNGAMLAPVSPEDEGEDDLPEEIIVPADAPAVSVEVCAQCRSPVDNTSHCYGDENGVWLHPGCERAFFATRMANEGIAWTAPADTPPPPPPPPTNSQVPPELEDPAPSTGNGHAPGGNGFDATARDGYASGEQQHGTVTARYVYKDEHGRLYMRVLRTSGKSFPTQHWANGRWVTGWPAKLIPYRMPELLAAPVSEPVWICEGEKDADNVAALGLIATTNPGGAGKWQPELNQWLKGKEIVYLLEDNDESGRKHTALVTAALRNVVPIIVTVSFPELPEKDDVSDWLELGGNRTLLIARAKIERERQSTQDVHLINLATVRSRAIEWLWPGHLARGGLELMAGTPEIGKSQIHCQYIAHLTTGRDWPNGMPGTSPCRVIMITAEDTTADTIVPRLKAAGANLGLVEQLHAIRRNGRDEMFLLGEDLERLARTVRHFGDVGLIAIDPITAYMGSNKHFDSHRATDVRSQLMPLKRFAEEFGIAISAITHPPKNASTQPLNHFIGSQAFIASARIGHLCIAEMEEDENGNKIPTGRRLFTNPKINIAARQPTLAYSIKIVDIEPDE
jgi:DNA polymerase I-like protein with 3'-5' exonuclease and polymerase domains